MHLHDSTELVPLLWYGYDNSLDCEVKLADMFPFT